MDPAASTAASARSTDAGDVLADVRLAAAGDGSAYARLIRRYQQPLLRRMRHFAGNPGDREELVQEVFVEAYFGLRGFRGDTDFSHWLMRIATRVGYRYFKRRRRESQRRSALESGARTGLITARTADSAEDAAAEATEAGRRLATVLDQLPPRDRLIVTLLYVEGHTVGQAAKLIGWSKTMVKVQAYRARNKLRKILEKSVSD